MEPTTRIELVTSSLPRMCSTDWATWAYEFIRRTPNSMNPAIIGASRHIFKKSMEWSGKRDSNPRPSAWKADALAPELFPLSRDPYRSPSIKGLYPIHFTDGGGRIRTSVGFAGRFTVCSLWPLGYPSSCITKCWSWRWDSNPQPADYKSAALPVELRQPTH